MTTQAYANHMSWRLSSCSNTYSLPNVQVISQQCCLPPGTYNLECKEDMGNGWNNEDSTYGFGSIYIEVDGTRYCENFTNGRVMINKITVSGTLKPLEINGIKALKES